MKIRGAGQAYTTPNAIQLREYSMGGDTDGVLYNSLRSAVGAASGTSSCAVTTTAGMTAGGLLASATFFISPSPIRSRSFVLKVVHSSHQEFFLFLQPWMFLFGAGGVIPVARHESFFNIQRRVYGCGGAVGGVSVCYWRYRRVT